MWRKKYKKRAKQIPVQAKSLAWSKTIKKNEFHLLLLLVRLSFSFISFFFACCYDVDFDGVHYNTSLSVRSVSWPLWLEAKKRVRWDFFFFLFPPSKSKSSRSAPLSSSVFGSHNSATAASERNNNERLNAGCCCCCAAATMGRRKKKKQKEEAKKSKILKERKKKARAEEKRSFELLRVWIWVIWSYFNAIGWIENRWKKRNFFRKWAIKQRQWGERRAKEIVERERPREIKTSFGELPFIIRDSYFTKKVHTQHITYTRMCMQRCAALQTDIKCTR